MVQQTIVHLIDDLDGGDADETLNFALDGVAYDIDLSKDHAEELRECLSQYVASARRSTVRPGARRPSAAAEKIDLKAARQWAHDNGYPVKDRGRLPANVLDAYKAANNL